MIYTSKDFGKDLKQKILAEESVEAIGQWAYDIYFNNMLDMNDNFRNILLALNKMELGPEFAYSYEELDKISDDLISGKEVKLFDSIKGEEK